MKFTTKKLCVTLAGLVLITNVFGTKYYVAPTGNDSNNGTAGAPFASIAHASTQAIAPGDTIFLMPGIYVEESQSELASGVTLDGSGTYGANKTVVTSTVYNASSIWGSKNGHIILIKNSGCTVSNISFNGNSRKVHGAIAIESAEDININHVHILDFVYVGLFVGNSSNITISYTYLEDSGHETNAYCAGSIWLQGVRNSQIHDIQIYSWEPLSGRGISAQGSLVNVDVYNTTIDIKKEAAWNGGEASNMDMEYFSNNSGEWGDNQIYNCHFGRQLSMDMRNAIVGDYSAWIRNNRFVMEGTPIEISSSKLIISNNYFTSKPGKAYDPMHDYKSSYTWDSMIVHHNVFENVGNYFYDTHAALTNAKIYNNYIHFAVNNGKLISLDDNGSGNDYDNFVFANNIIVGKNTNYIVMHNATLTNEIIEGNLYKDVDNFPNLKNSFGTPELTYSGNKPYPYYYPTSGGNTINIANGVDMGDSYIGSGPDAGAFEYGSISEVVATAVTMQKPADTIYMNAGENFILSAWQTPMNVTNKWLVWSSDNPSVVNVNETGLITALSEGTAIISVVPESGVGSDQVVIQSAIIPVDSITINNHEPIIYPLGATLDLDATVYPVDASNKSYTWASSNSAIVSVDQNGLITFKTAGEAKISVTTASGIKTDTIKVISGQVQTFTLSTVASIGGSVIPEGTNVYDKDEVVWITATPDDGYKFDSWSGAYTGTINPTALVIKDDLTIIAQFSKATALNDAFISKLKLYPNPIQSGGLMNIQHSGTNKVVSASINDMLGNTIPTRLVNNETIEIPTIAKGVYTLSITIEGKGLYNKTIIVK